MSGQARPEDATSLARRLDTAMRTRRAIAAADIAPDMDLDGAYAVQRAWLDLRTATGCRPAGYKVGFTGEGLQRQFGATGPTVGMVTDDMIHAGVLPDHFITPRIEMELAMVMGRSLAGADRPIGDVLNAVDHIRPAFEIIDNRIGPPPTLTHIVADNCGCAGAVLGGLRMLPGVTDLCAIGASLSINGTVVGSGASTAVLGHPARALVALLDHLASRGEGLMEGDVILTGAFAMAVPIRSGDMIRADYGPLGDLSTRLS
jgi:2-oxo-hept-3-ene-1,7-dioate hydratase